MPILTPFSIAVHCSGSDDSHHIAHALLTARDLSDRLCSDGAVCCGGCSSAPLRWCDHERLHEHGDGARMHTTSWTTLPGLSRVSSDRMRNARGFNEERLSWHFGS